MVQGVTVERVNSPGNLSYYVETQTHKNEKVQEADDLKQENLSKRSQ